LENGGVNAKKEGYTDEQIAEYRQYVEICVMMQKTTKIETKQ